MKMLVIALVLMLGNVFPASAQVDHPSNRKEMNTIRLTIKGGKTFTATLADNSSAEGHFSG